MKMALKRTLRAGLSILCASAVGCMGILAYAKPSVSELEEKTSGLQGELDSLNSELQNMTVEIESLSAQIQETEASMSKTQKEMDQTQKDGKAQYEAMKLRIKYMYEAGNTSFLELLCSARNMPDFLNKSNFIQDVSRYDREMLQELLDTQKQMEQKGKKLEEQQNALSEMQKELDAKRSELKDKISSTSSEIQNYTEQLTQAKEEERLAALQAAQEAAEKAARQTPQTPATRPENPPADTPSPDVSTDGKQSLGSFLITHYCPCYYCCGGWGTSTATGTVPTPGRTIAVDPRVIPYGTKVIINGHVYVAEDCGGGIKGNKIDIFVSDHATALASGVYYTEVYLAN